MRKNGYGNLSYIPKSMQETALEKPSKPILTKIVSNTPGRLRLRVAQPQRWATKMQHILKTLKAQPNISQVRMNLQNGSITIQHDDNENSLKNVVTTLQDLGVIFADITGFAETTGGKSEVAAGVSDVVVDLNRRVKEATDGVVDLRFLFPLGLATLSIRQLIARGLQLEMIPWYVLAWYAFDSFIKLHGTNQSQSTNE
ncbi:hypothetical protein QUB80_14735 [Chlorogloeopsis sp. ULAP01]|uniref:HMA2 domain-containing protein n=1 Tax=Chlorogloeopsis sp. ULAP01 TaxID=3056483 RepID=UPI0025AA5971|nr:hypothetical protein [Chlorogloeopsis sp. ULAP01]MDM9381958.1 hypothetical protein [Chlorogloeopsis sp. ULAP01]